MAFERVIIVDFPEEGYFSWALLFALEVILVPDLIWTVTVFAHKADIAWSTCQNTARVRFKVGIDWI